MKPSPHLDEIDLQAIALADSVVWGYWSLAASSKSYRSYIARLYAEWARGCLRAQAGAVIEGHRN